MTDPVQPDIELLRDLRRLRLDGSDVIIGARAFDVLAYLHANARRVVTKAELLENVWADLNVEESNLTVQIAALRKLIGARAIATVPGVGYQLTLSAKAPAEPPSALPLPDKPSLAVLRFANLTGDAGKDYLGDTDQAIDHFTRAIRINPLDPIIGQVCSGLGATPLLAGRLEEGVAALEQAFAEAPNYTASLEGLAWGYWELGRTDDAQRLRQLLRAREPGMTITATLRDRPTGCPTNSAVTGLTCLASAYRSDQRCCKSRSTALRASSWRACAARISSGARRMALRWSCAEMARSKAPQAVRNKAIIGAKAAATFPAQLTGCEWLMRRSVRVCCSGPD